MALDLLTPVSDTFRRDLIASDTAMIDPDDASCLNAGEWVGLDSSSQAQEALDDIAAGSGGSPIAGEGPFYQVFTQKGDYGAQALSKICVLMSMDYEAETDMYRTGVTFTVGMELTITNSDTGGGGTGDDTRNILDEAASSDMVLAICTGVPSSTASGKLRFQRVSPYIKG
jgi:hypothetical protein